MNEPFKSWAVLELMGHLRRVGYVAEVEVAGGKLLRIDIPRPEGDITEFYGVNAVYALRPCSEEIARTYAEREADPRPLRPLEFRDKTPAQIAQQREEGSEFEESIS